MPYVCSEILITSPCTETPLYNSRLVCLNTSYTRKQCDTWLPRPNNREPACPQKHTYVMHTACCLIDTRLSSVYGAGGLVMYAAVDSQQGCHHQHALLARMQCSLLQAALDILLLLAACKPLPSAGPCSACPCRRLLAPAAPCCVPGQLCLGLAQPPQLCLHVCHQGGSHCAGATGRSHIPTHILLLVACTQTAPRQQGTQCGVPLTDHQPDEKTNCKFQ